MDSRSRLLPRLLWVLLAMGLVFANLPTTLADHPDENQALDHFRVAQGSLEAEESNRLPIRSTSHGDLREGWIYIVHAVVEGNHSLEATLEHDHEPVTSFTWDHDTPTTGYTKIQSTGPHELVIHNPGNETVDYQFYYDQSCNCESKLIPLSGGAVLFDYPIGAGTTVQLSYPVAHDWHLKATLATHDEDLPSADWPQDFEILEEQEAQGPGEGISGTEWINFTVNPQAHQRYYVHIESLHGGTPDNPIMLSAIADLLAEQEAPAPAVGLLVLLTLGLVTVVRRFKTNG